MNQSLPTSPRIAVVSACWHRDIVQSAVSSLRAELRLLGLPASHIEEFERPGAFELPLAAQQLAATGRYRAIVACGLVVDGGIYRHDFVASAVIDGLMRVQLDSGVPVFSAVLTPHHFHDHAVHQQFFSQHFIAKGREVALACVQTLAAEDQLAIA